MSVVVTDRYLPDLVVWVVLTTCDPGYADSPAARLLLASSSGTAAEVYVTVELGELARRGVVDPRAAR